MSEYQLKRKLNDLMWGFLAVIGIILLVALGIMFFTFVMSIVAFFLAIGFIYWMLGGKITVTQDDHVIGYVRWFEYTEVARAPKPAAPYKQEKPPHC